VVSSWTGQLVTHKLCSHRLRTCHQQRVVDTADHAHDTLVLSATLHYLFVDRIRETLNKSQVPIVMAMQTVYQKSQKRTKYMLHG